MTNNLLPCPFCGAEAKIKKESLDERYGYAQLVTTTCIKCKCSKSAMGDTSKGGYADNSTVEQRATNAWNTRAAPDGMVMVPVEITDAMIDAFDVTLNEECFRPGKEKDGAFKAAYKAMINASSR